MRTCARRLAAIFRLLAPLTLFLCVIASTRLPGAKPDAMFSEFPIPTADSFAVSIARGPDGNLWFVESGRFKIGRLSPNGTFMEFPVPYGTPTSLRPGPDGRIWVTEIYEGRVAVFSLAGVFEGQFNASISAAVPATLGLSAGPDGQHMWFANGFANTIARVRTDGSGLQEFNLKTSHSYPNYTSPGTGGSVWFTEESGHSVGRIDATGAVVEWRLPDAALAPEPQSIALGPDGNMWITTRYGDSIERVTPTGEFTKFRLPHTDAQAQEIIAGPDGAMWFTQLAYDRIGHITIDGKISEYSLPADKFRQPWSLTVGPDGAVWFTERAANRIGRLAPDVFQKMNQPATVPTLAPTALKVLALAIGALGLRRLA